MKINILKEFIEEHKLKQSNYPNCIKVLNILVKDFDELIKKDREIEMKIIPYRYTTDEEDNAIYDIVFLGSDNKTRYQLKIVIDELNDNLMVTEKDVFKLPMSQCQCKDFVCRQKKEFHKCKHMIEGLKILRSYGIKIREKK